MVMGPEEITWQMVNNLLSRVGNRLTTSGLAFTVTVFLLGTLMASTVAQENTPTGISGLLTVPGASFWRLILWALIAAAMIFWGAAFLFLLLSAVRLAEVQRRIRAGVDALLGINASDARVEHMVKFYAADSASLSDVSQLVTYGTLSLFLGTIPAVVGLGVWLRMVV